MNIILLILYLTSCVVIANIEDLKKRVLRVKDDTTNQTDDDKFDNSHQSSFNSSKSSHMKSLCTFCNPNELLCGFFSCCHCSAGI